MKDETTKTNKELREEALKGFSLTDDRLKLSHPIWHSITRRANQLGMTEEERMKMIAVNLAQSTLEIMAELTAAQSQITELKLENQTLIRQLREYTSS